MVTVGGLGMLGIGSKDHQLTAAPPAPTQDLTPTAALLAQMAELTARAKQVPDPGPAPTEVAPVPTSPSGQPATLVGARPGRLMSPTSHVQLLGSLIESSGDPGAAQTTNGHGPKRFVAAFDELLGLQTHALEADIQARRAALLVDRMDVTATEMRQAHDGSLQYLDELVAREELLVDQLKLRLKDCQVLKQLLIDGEDAFFDAPEGFADPEEAFFDASENFEPYTTAEAAAHPRSSGPDADESSDALEELPPSFDAALDAAHDELDTTISDLESQCDKALAILRQDQDRQQIEAQAHALRATEVELGAAAMARERTRLAYRSTSADAAPERAMDQATKAQEKVIEQSLNSPPGFTHAYLAQAGSKELSERLKGVLSCLEPIPGNERTLPATASFEVLSRALAHVTNIDPARADLMLQQLTTRSPLAWMLPPDPPVPHAGQAGHPPAGSAASSSAGPPSQCAADADCGTLIRMMAKVPRGLEILCRLGPQDEAPAESLEAMQVYWQAVNACQQDETSAEVKDWLQGAMHVACQMVHLDEPPPITPALAAYHAVRNGFVSNAAGSHYAQADAQLRQLSEGWLRAPGESARASLSLPGSLLARSPTRPFTPAAVFNVGRNMEDRGLPTVKSRASESFKANAQALATALRQAPAGNATIAPGPQPQPEADPPPAADVVMAALCDYIAGHQGKASTASRWHLGRLPGIGIHFNDTRRIYKARLTPKDFAQVLDQVGQALPGSSTAGLRGALPHRIQQLMQRKAVDPLELLEEVVREMKLRSAPEPNAADHASFDLDALRAQVATARRRKIERPQELIDFIDPVLDGLVVRDKIAVAAGGGRGIGLALPWVPRAARLVLSATRDKRIEAGFQISNPRFAIELNVSDAKSTVTSGKAGAGMGIAAGPAELNAVMGTVQGAHSSELTRSTTLRIPRIKDAQGERDQPQAIADTRLVLNNLVKWEERRNESTGLAFAGPLETLLAHHPTLEVAIEDKDHAKTSIGMRAESGAFFKMTQGTRVGPGAAVYARGEKTKETYTELQAPPTQQPAKSHADRRAFKVAGELGVRARIKLVNHPVNETKPAAGKWRMTEDLGSASLAYNFVEMLRKNEARMFSIGESMGASVDVQFSGKAELLAEIAHHRSAWLERCIDTLPKQADRTPLEAGTQAEERLRAFEATLRATPDDPNLVHTIKYELRPDLSGWIDALRALGEVAKQTKDEDGQKAAAAKAQALLEQPSSWVPKTMSQSSKTRDQRELGWNIFARIHAHWGSEVQRAKVEFPR